MLTKTIKIDDKEVLFAASAAIPRIYRIQFRRDIFQDMAKIEKSVKKSQDKQTETKVSESDIPIEDLEMFENVAFVNLIPRFRSFGHHDPDDGERHAEQRCGAGDFVHDQRIGRRGPGVEQSGRKNSVEGETEELKNGEKERPPPQVQNLERPAFVESFSQLL